MITEKRYRCEGGLKSWILKMLEVYEDTNLEVVMDQLTSIFLDYENHDLHFIKLPVKPPAYQAEKAFLNCFWELLENIDFDGDEAWLSNLYMLSRQKLFHFSTLRNFLDKKPMRRRFPFWFKKQKEEENEFFRTFEVHEQMAYYQDEKEEKTTLLSDNLKTQVLMSGFQFGYLEDKDHQFIFISQTPWLIGRKESCQLCLSFPEISKEHAQLVIEDGCCYVIDLNSTNHTTLNDRVLHPLSKERLTNGDNLSFAGHLYIYHV